MSALALLHAATFALLVGCAAAPSNAAPSAPPAEVALPPPGARPAISYEALDGTAITLDSLAGRVTVIGFVTTYDLASQVQARFLAGLLRDHTPRLNVVLLVLEPPENRPLVEAFAASLRLPYPVALADPATIAGQGPFAGLHQVPSLVVLDRKGREAYRAVGLQTQQAIEAVVRAVERADQTNTRK